MVFGQWLRQVRHPLARCSSAWAGGDNLWQVDGAPLVSLWLQSFEYGVSCVLVLTLQKLCFSLLGFVVKLERRRPHQEDPPTSFQVLQLQLATRRLCRSSFRSRITEHLRSTPWLPCARVSCWRRFAWSLRRTVRILRCCRRTSSMWRRSGCSSPPPPENWVGSLWMTLDLVQER